MTTSLLINADLDAAFEGRLKDATWRLTSGQLYKVMTKDDPTQPGAIMPFIPYPEQREFLLHMHYRNVILKDRQRGYTTAGCIYLLDHALFVADQRCGFIAHTMPDAQAIFRDKVKFAYENLPDIVRGVAPLKSNRSEELLFAHNNSSVRVSTSMRSATIHRLHVSEMGKISVHDPGKATEIVSGALPAVPLHGVATIESTAEGASGRFFDIASKAQELWEKGAPIGERDYKFFFSAWWTSEEHMVDPDRVRISPKEHEYFDAIERTPLFIGRMGPGAVIIPEQRAWYVSTRETIFGGDQVLMWREYPSSPAECWQQSTEGAYYANELARARVSGRIVPQLPVSKSVPCNTFWDIGSRDGMAVWVHQHIRPEHRFIRFRENWQTGFDWFLRELDDMQFIWGTHFLPHDASHERQGESGLWSPLSVLQKMKPTWRFAIVPRVNELRDGINATRMIFPECWFDETECKEGLAHLAGYRKRLNSATGYWMEEPIKDVHTEAADAFRQFAQAIESVKIAGEGLRRPTRNRK